MLVIHGGTGIEREYTSPAAEAAIRAVMTQTLKKGQAPFAAGNLALDAVTAAITTLDDHPLFSVG